MEGSILAQTRRIKLVSDLRVSILFLAQRPKKTPTEHRSIPVSVLA